MVDNIELKYSVGALLYTPALNSKVADSVILEKICRPYSLAICLEDTISEGSVGLAEKQLVATVKRISEEHSNSDFYLPKIFIRVRSCDQLLRLSKELSAWMDVVSGFIFPKYSLNNADSYNEAMIKINESARRQLYMMPILESRDIVEYSTRQAVLAELKAKIDSVKDIVINIRVGGNDFSNEFATRRHYDETIYDILPIAQLLGDILTVFSRDYVLSGPVWEFFSSDNEEWKRGLRNELKLDRLNGFIGKTVIHPKQINVVNEALKVTNKDFEDAKAILNWDENGLQVGKSFSGERMNEVHTHINWAIKTITLAGIYGVI